MGAYAYCDNCNGPLAEPTLLEGIADDQTCPLCGNGHYTTAGDKIAAVTTVLNRLERVERVLAVLVPAPPA